jgi:tRNA(His) guanylyltransferase
MKQVQLERMMRRLESYHSLRVPDEAITIIRVDGRSFTSLIKELKYTRPFDREFSEAMQTVAEGMLKEFSGAYAYTQSDEISIMLPPESQLFDRCLEKLVSITASFAASEFSMVATRLKGVAGRSRPVCFDSRVLVVNTYEQAEDYFRWRQSDATRNYLNSLAYWTSRAEGNSPRQSGKMFEGTSPKYKLDYLEGAGIKPDFQSPYAKGIGFTWEIVTYNGLNKLTGERVPTTRRAVKAHTDLPTGDDYAKFLSTLY